MYNIVKQSCQNVLMVYIAIMTCTCFPYEQRVNLYPCAQQHLKYSIKNKRRVDGNDLITCPDVNIRAWIILYGMSGCVTALIWILAYVI